MDVAAAAALGKLAPDDCPLDHLFAEVAAPSPDGECLLLHVWGHASSGPELSRYYVVSAADGSILNGYKTLDEAPLKW